MKITVAIPCYNLENRISVCLESVIASDYQDIEIFVVDDCSTDCSVKLIKSFIEKHPEREFRFIVNKENIGLNQVRNFFIKEAHGELLFFVDGDDTIEPETLSLLYHRMEDTHVDVVCGCYRKKDFDGNTYLIKQFPDDTIIGDFSYATYIERYISGYFNIAVWNRLYRLDFLRSHNICCSNQYRIHEDCLFTFKVVQNAQSISFVHDITYNYCDCPTSICYQKADVKFFYLFRTLITSVIDAEKDFENSHKDLQVPYGIRFLLNYICLTNGLLKKCLESDVNKKEKNLLLKWLRGLYRDNGMNWNNIAGPYNKISYIILISPFPYPLFRLYLRNLGATAKIVNYLISKTKKKKWI